MPNPYASTFLTHPKYDGKYIWRTWFIEECEENSLFGMKAGNFRKVVEHGYKIGTELYLEDAPYYWHTSSKHRICGPYSVHSATLPHHGCKIKQQDKAGNV